MLIVMLQPRQHLLGCVGRNQNLEPSLGNPLSCKGAQQFGLPAAMWSGAPSCLIRCPSLGASSTHCEAQTAEDPASLMGGEVGTIESRNDGDDLLGRIPAPIHHDKVIRNRVRKGAGQSSADLVCLEIEPVPRDGRVYLIHTL